MCSTAIQALGPFATLTFNYPSWSISTEFYAYLLFGSCVLWMGAGRRLAVVAALIVSTAVATLLLTGNTFLPETLVRLSFVRCVLGFFVGVLTYMQCGADSRGRRAARERDRPFSSARGASCGSARCRIRSI